jgi:hypothetical protein
LDLPVEKDDTLTYEVPLVQYFTSISVKTDRAGYEKLKVYIQRNIQRALLLFDRPNANRFRKDWLNAIEMFKKVGAIDEDYAKEEKTLAENYDAVAVQQGAQVVMRGVSHITSQGWFTKALAIAGLFGGAYLLAQGGKQKRTRR